ncbi:competence/damage-inducible protein A [Clostridium cellulovorans]|uniref:Putative competence-damage inducible protein n=1 Tax=Clostridium cellulovorans (strain ATCC 35296 / DSM 3052 / OCM 3 / 743B) TaxID=573061 RepID=D9SPA0_CLOC7|nr:competence/damage-inducible protein A [Clostridium cellulovorans]ADL54002.1 competence/damage-inducible protein CinA [Clostridium cellulovorans 743B]
MKAEILCVGTELLLGDIVNTNAQYLSQELAALGVNVYHQSVVGDNPGRVKEVLDNAYKSVDLVITTGGLGPTKDDLTKEVIAEYFNKELKFNEEALKNIEDIFKRIGREVTESNKKQAYIPEGAIILHNQCGTAPGCIIEDEGKVLIMLPGPPREMKAMFKQAKDMYLNKKSDKTLISKVLRVYGLPEAQAADTLDELLDNSNPTVAPYAKEHEITFRVTASANNEEEAIKIMQPIIDTIKDRLGQFVYGEDEDTLESVVAKILVERNLTLATAESCTGGLLAGTFINYPGISKVFKEGFITYSNEAKEETLGVNKELLEKYGAVSEEVAREMAKKVAEKAGVNIGLSTTGIAGPDGGTDEKPVGLVYIGCCINGEVKVKKLNLNGDRQKVRNRTVLEVINLLRCNLIK